MSVDFRQADFEDLCEIYNRSMPARYAIDPVLLRQHTVDSPSFDWGASCIDPGKAFVAVKKSPSNLYKGSNPDVSYICALGYQEPTVLLDLFKEVKRCLIDRGVAKLSFGSDSGHLFPGCPIDCSNLRHFLLIGGFEEGSESHDLERDLSDYEIPRPIPEGFSFRPVGQTDLPLLDEFLTREFSGRWRYDTFRKISEEADPGVIFGLFDGNTCEGFALTQFDGCETQIGGAVWKNDLGPNWCSLGPIGVSRRVRGKGCGTALLGTALSHLKAKGGRRCIIDWTGLVGFYGSHGFTVTRTYTGFSLDFERYRAV